MLPFYESLPLLATQHGVETDDVANYCFPKTWPADRGQRAVRRMAADRGAVSGSIEAGTETFAHPDDRAPAAMVVAD